MKAEEKINIVDLSEDLQNSSFDEHYVLIIAVPTCEVTDEEEFLTVRKLEWDHVNRRLIIHAE